ncbi:hypothetical protein TNIN_144381 [Trichonephila inaurata madagascariensis]|uniref:Uncharacterized protein n=1 Tax=Trichonephila inaurata madagascariensis TaxID=2747483 RepID=A0A8X6ICP7_9ARAC|nr:hypothetical protein TNIN_144381 [Trichonephila inaurata madagascariensis]
MDASDTQRSCDKPIILSIHTHPAFYNVLTFTGNLTRRPKLKEILSARLRPVLSFSQHIFMAIHQKVSRKALTVVCPSKEMEKLFNGLSVNTAWGRKALAVFVTRVQVAESGSIVGTALLLRKFHSGKFDAWRENCEHD